MRKILLGMIVFMAIIQCFAIDDFYHIAFNFNENLPKGYHKVAWDGTDSYHNSVSSGIYFYKLETKQANDVGKMILLK